MIYLQKSNFKIQRMKVFNLVSNIVIIVALVVMGFMHPWTACEGSADVAVAKGGKLAVAYVNIDSLLMNYQQAIDLNEELMSQQEEARTDLNGKARKLESEMVNFQRKVENNGFLTRERAESEQRRLLGEQQKLEETQQRMANELGLKQQDVNDQVMTAITEFITAYNKKANYEVILTQTGGIGTVLFAKSAYNITADVLEQMNEQFAKK